MMVYGRIEYLPIYKLLNLQTFIFLLDSRYSITWKMSQLRHLHCRSIYFLSSPPNKYRVLENLRSVSGLNPSCCTKEIFEGIKKVKQLGICNFELNFSSDPNCLDNLRYLHELEALSIVSYSLPRSIPCPASFPPKLKKLTLCKTFLLWEDMAIISRLPKLEVLQLKAQAFECNDCNGETIWEVTDMGFPVLKFFLLEWLDLEYWRATDDYFPCLERIIIRNCHKLKEIPQVLADSVTLQLIELRGCSSSLVTFATKIQENHEDLGNNILKVDAFDTIRGQRLFNNIGLDMLFDNIFNNGG
ncbi:hypothetical protein H5410_039778 [Solanum commersonii]|uniref:Late blight resistance protein n=1 Tax=Solanum commersonii TaxID=4109 RepID=A0A9J5XQ76_SOLCO|nr:hypothetical protein H5410_039778 [Solanum commersonii]